MSRRPGVLLLAAAVAVGLSVLLAGAGARATAAGRSGHQTAAIADPAASGGRWRAAIEVPGSAALNQGVGARVISVACAAAGDCSAGGFYRDGSGHVQAFVVSQWNGRWRKAIEVPGSAALNEGRDVAVSSLACGAVGDCLAGGSYLDGSGNSQAFVVTQENGRWRNAIEAPGSAALNRGGYAGLQSVACSVGGGCSAGGYYMDGSGHLQAFVVARENGRWGKAIEVPGVAALNKGRDAAVSSVSCAPGNCSAGGFYTDGSGHFQAFVVSQNKGRWGNAIEVPGVAALNQGRDAAVSSVSCRAGSCSAGGTYTDGSNHTRAFVVAQENGRWGKAIEVPGSAALGKGGVDQVSSVSCAAAGSCSAGGSYLDGSFHLQAFVVAQENGRWGKAIEVPGSAALNKGGYGGVSSVSCAMGSCSAGGFYRDRFGHDQALVVTQENGRWGNAIEVPGSAALNADGVAAIYSMSCATAASCSAGGSYKDASARLQAFVVSRI